ncbi:PadR family transcriptional regulator [Salinibacterium sp. NYA9b]
MVESAASTQLRRGVVGPCILALLSTGPRFGLQIVRELNDVGQLLTSQGTVYPLLSRLQEAGQVSSHWEVSDTERPRRYYSLTDVGRCDLELFREDWRQFSDSVGSLLETVPSASVPSASIESELP